MVITDDTRIKETLPTIGELLGRNARVILCSHLGRPKGKADAKQKALALKDGEVLLLENVRFHAQEEKNVPEFAAQLAELAEIFVNDAFGSAHRAHASTEGVTHHVKESVAGLLMEKELRYL